jgi:ElaB/YqjD/DUF883 family membrane-anchored ribosome-binding protein
MPPRDSQLPEGTDHIINGAMETGAGSGASTGSSATGSTGGGTTGGTTTGGTTTGGTTTGTGGGGSSSGFIGGTASGLDDTGGTASSTTGSGGSGGSSGSSSGSDTTTGKIASQVRDQVQSLKGQATDKARQFADQGKDRATSALDNFTEVLHDAARSVDERLGGEYGQYAHRAADAVASMTDGFRGKSVDDLLDDSRTLIRKSPGIAIGAAALIGFALVRVVKAGIPAGDTNVDFTPDPQLTDQSGTTGTRSTGAGTGTATGTGV